MSSVSSINNSSGAAAGSAAAATSTAKSTLTTQDFLQLLSTQLQNQDPLKPMDDSAYLAQMAQFTSLQQVNTLSNTISLMRSDQQNLAATSYLGRVVTMDDGNSSTVSGTVTAVDTSGATPNLEINGKYYPLTSLLSVSSAPASTAASTSTGTN